MQVFTNLWGGEGFLTTTSLLAMASVGMFNDVMDMEVYYRCLDFATESEDDTRWRKIKEAYEKYSGIIFGNNIKPCLIHDNVKINSLVNMDGGNNPTLSSKYRNKEYLSIGCSENDMELNIRSGIYGKPWVGEAYHANTEFRGLYDSASGDIITINCGGYKGGGTAATFIYLENKYRVSDNNTSVTSHKRYNVIAGPSTQFGHKVKLPHPELYPENDLKNEISIFELDSVIERLAVKQIPTSKSHLHEDNIKFLRREWDKVKNDREDHTNLNPMFYMARFIDRISSDNTLQNVINFINIKSNLRPDGMSYNYDKTSDIFSPDNQAHLQHITNMINAVTIQEIVLNHRKNMYNAGKIYTFCVPNDTKYTIEGVFRPEDAKRFYRFLIFSSIIVNYVHNCFYDITNAGSSIMIDKWAIKRRRRALGFIPAGVEIPVDTESKEGKNNTKFANFIKKYIADFAYEYIRPVLKVFIEVDSHENVEFFPKKNIGNDTFKNGIHGIVRDLIKSIKDNGIKEITEPREIMDKTENTIAAIIMGREGNPLDFDGALKTIQGQQGENNNFLQKYQTTFPEYGKINGNLRIWEENADNNIQSEAESYAQRIIKHTYEQVSNLI